MQAGPYDYIWNPIRTHEGWRAGLGSALRTTAYRILSDETLVRRVRAKDHAAFDALLARYRSRLHTMALGFLGNEYDADDAVCEMVLSAFKDCESFGAKCTPGTWLYQHGLRAVFARMNVPSGRYAYGRRLRAGPLERLEGQPSESDQDPPLLRSA